MTMPRFLKRLACSRTRFLACVALICCVSTSPLPSGAAAQTGKPDCGGSSTLADYDANAVQPADAFLQRLKSAVRTDDRQTAAALVSYPLRVYSGSRQRRIFSTRTFLLVHFDVVFTRKVQQAILAQVPSCLFANSQGIMIGDGEVWFNKTPEGTYAITSINAK